jgi:tetratricopeptide (TPR) repeat protein
MREADGASDMASRLLEVAHLAGETLPDAEVVLDLYRRAWEADPTVESTLETYLALARASGQLERLVRAAQAALETHAGRTGLLRARLRAELADALLDLGRVEEAAHALDLGAAAFDDWEALVSVAMTAPDDAPRLLQAVRLLAARSPRDRRRQALLTRMLAVELMSPGGMTQLDFFLTSHGHLDQLATWQDRWIASAGDAASSNRLRRRFSLDWLRRLGDRRRGAGLLVDGLEASGVIDDERFCLAVFAREALRDAGQWEALLALAEVALAAPKGAEQLAYVEMIAAMVVWLELEDRPRARERFDALRAIAPDNGVLAEFDQSTHSAAPVAVDVDISGAFGRLLVPEPAATPANAGEDLALEIQIESPAQVSAEPAVAAVALPPRPQTTSVPAAKTAPLITTPVSIGEAPAETLEASQQTLVDAARAADDKGDGTASPDLAITAWKKAVAQAPDKRTPRRGLARALCRAERWPPLIDALRDEEQKACPTAVERVAVLLEVVAVYDRLGQGLMSAKVLSQALQLDPANLDVVNRLVAQYQALKRWLDVAQALGHKASLLTDSKEKLSLRLELARLQVERLNNPGEAVRAYEAALELDSQTEEARSYLRQAYERRLDWEKLYLLRAEEVVACADQAQRAEQALALARFAQEKVKKAELVIAAWERVVEIVPDQAEALSALERLYEKERRWEPLATVWERLAALYPTERRDALLPKLAVLYTDKLGNPTKAIIAWRALFDAHPENARALEALKKLYVSEGAWDDLANLYRAQGRVEDLARLLERLAAEADGAGRVDLLDRLATIEAESLNKPDRARRTLEQILELDRGHRKAAERLLVLYNADGANAPMAKVLELLLEGAPGPRTVERLRLLAGLYEQDLHDWTAALRTRLRLLTMLPGDGESLDAAELAAKETGQWPLVLEMLERGEQALSDSAEGLALTRRTARIQDEVVTNPPAAIAAYKRILGARPEDRAALDALERLYEATGQMEELRGVCERKLQLFTEPPARRAARYRLAGLLEKSEASRPLAIATYRTILDDEPNDLDALTALDRLYQGTEAWLELTTILEREIDLVRGQGMPDRQAAARLATLLFRHAELLQVGEGPATAGRALEEYREVLRIVPDHEGARGTLEKLLADPSYRLTAASILEPVYASAGEVTKLIAVYEVLIAHAEAGSERVDLLHRLATLLEARLERSAAFAALSRALREDASRTDTLDRLEKVVESTGAWPDLAALYKEVASQRLALPQQVEVRTRLGRLYTDRLSAPDRAVATYRRILDLDSGNRPSVRALLELLEKGEQWSELAEVMQRAIHLAEDPEHAAALERRLAVLLHSKLTNPAGAVEAYVRLLDLKPRDTDALDALAKLLEADLAGALPERDARRSLIERLAKACEDDLRDAGRGFRFWSIGFADDPLWASSADGLERAARPASAWKELVTLCQRLISQGPPASTVRRLELLAARIRERELGETGPAIETYLTLLNEIPDDPEALSGLERAYQTAGRHKELVALLRERATEAKTPAVEAELTYRLGLLQGDVLADLDEAMRCQERVLTVAPKHRGALEALESLHARRRDWDRAFETYERRIAAAEHDQERAETYAKMARLAENELFDDERAIQLWGRVLSVRSDDPVALDALATLHEQRGQWAELIALLEDRLRSTREPTAVVTLFQRLGRAWSKRPGYERTAIEAWRLAVELAPADLESLSALASLYRLVEDWGALGATLGSVLEVGVDALSDQDKVLIHGELAELWAARLDAPEQAVDEWREVLAIAPSDTVARMATVMLLARLERWEECVALLDEGLALAEAEGDDEACVRALLRMAWIAFESQADETRAVELYERVRLLDPSEPTASEGLEALYRKNGKPERVVDVLRERIAYREDRGTKLAVLREIARIEAEDRKDVAAAFDALCEGARLGVEVDMVLSDLRRLADSSNEWERLVDGQLWLIAALEITEPLRAADLWIEIAAVHRDRLGRPSDACIALDAALALEPEHESALDALATLQERRGAWGDVLELRRRRLALADDPPTQLALWLGIAEAAGKLPSGQQEAIESYKGALAIDPACAEALAALEKLYRQELASTELYEVLSRRAAAATDPAEKMRMLLEAGQLAESANDGVSRAIECYRAVFDLEPGSREAGDALERLYTRTGEWGRLLEVLDRRLALASGVDQQMPLLASLAAIAAKAGDTKRALDGFVRAAEMARELGRHDEVLSNLGRALDIDTAHGPALEALVALRGQRPSAVQEAVDRYVRTYQWRKAVDLHLSLASVEPASDRRGRHFYAAGLLCRDRLLRRQEAVTHLRRAIDCHLASGGASEEALRAFEAVDQTLTAEKDWPELERSYRDMIERTPNGQNPMLLMMLWQNLGELYRARLNDETKAAQAFERARSVEETLMAPSPLAMLAQAEGKAESS